MDRIGLNISLEEDITKLSGGERQRISLLRILLSKLKVILLDEPIANFFLLTNKVSFWTLGGIISNFIK